MHLPLSLILITVPLVACAEPEPAGTPPSETPTTPKPRAWQRFEATLDLAVPAEGADNPFDPGANDVTVTFEGPDGATFAIPAFVYQGFERALDAGGRERLAPVGDREWRVRFRPPFGSPAGAWRWRYRTRTPAGDETSEWRSFTAIADETPTAHGLVRRSTRDARYLVHEDDSPFFAIGENMAWYDARGTYAYDEWVAELSAHGGNYIRVWMPSWAFGLEWVERDADGAVAGSSLGDYGARLDRAWQLDHVLDLAEAHGLQVMLTILNHGPWSFVHASQWDDNPYNADNGGPLAGPTEVFTDPTAKALHKRLLRYLVARWGHSPNILAWELWNEVDLVADPALPEVAAWTEDMARELDRLDPYDHLVTTSLGGLEVLLAFATDDLDALVERYAFWSMPELDFTQLHFYGIGTTRIDFSTDLAKVAGYLHAFGKPVLIAEAGVNANGAAETLVNDPEGVAFHDTLWAGLFAETFGTGMSWWWDGITHPEGYVSRLAPIAELVRDVRFETEGFVRADAEVTHPAGPLTARVLRGEHTVLAWIKNPRHQWFGVDPTTIEGATVTLTDVPAGVWRASWIDPYAERATTTVEATTIDGTLRLEIPAFARDIALRLDALDP